MLLATSFFVSIRNDADSIHRIFPEKKSSRSGHFFIEFTTQIPPTMEEIIQTASHPTTVIESAY